MSAVLQLLHVCAVASHDCSKQAHSCSNNKKLNTSAHVLFASHFIAYAFAHFPHVRHAHTHTRTHSIWPAYIRLMQRMTLWASQSKMLIWRPCHLAGVVSRTKRIRIGDPMDYNTQVYYSCENMWWYVYMCVWSVWCVWCVWSVSEHVWFECMCTCTILL